MLEKEIEKYLVDRVKKAGGQAYKFVSPGVNGVPDRLITLPGGVIVFAELKAPGRKPTALQEFRIKKLRDVGQRVFVIDSRDGVDKLMELLTEKRATV